MWEEYLPLHYGQDIRDERKNRKDEINKEKERIQRTEAGDIKKMVDLDDETQKVRNKSITSELVKDRDKRIANEQAARDNVREVNKQKKDRGLLTQPTFPSCPSFHNGHDIILHAGFPPAQSSLTRLPNAPSSRSPPRPNM